MAGFFRKVAGAFVEFGDEDPTGSGKSAEANLDDITQGTSELLAQLEGIQASESSGSPSPSAASHATLSSAAGGSAGGSAGAPASAFPTINTGTTGATGAGSFSAPLGSDGPDSLTADSSVMTMTAEQVFQQAGLVDGPNSAARVLKLIAGLTMFPPEQQIIMVRAMDTADDSWSEPKVLSDARVRQSSLRGHLQVLEDERNRRIQSIDEQVAATRLEGQDVIAEIDRRMSELQQKRQAAIEATTSAEDHLDQEKHGIEQQATAARRGITHVINALSSLLTFFADSRGAAPPS